jgi:hypothetical protein
VAEFHGVSRLSPDAAAAVPVAADDVASFWIRDRDQVVGLIRLFDLDDVDNGSALFDLRIATEHRGRGIGRLAENGDDYVLLTLLLASALFFAGVTTSFKMQMARLVLLGLASVRIAYCL